MKPIEIVKVWNALRGTRYPLANGNEPSAIVKRVETLTGKYGEENVDGYFRNVLEKTAEADIWKAANDEVALYAYANEQNQKKEGGAGSSALSVLSGEIVSLMGKELAERINGEVEKRISEFVQDKTMVKVVEYDGSHRKVDGVAHEKFETVLKFVAMDEPVMLTGPAGTGKNFLAKQVADALGLDFYFSNAVTQEYKITGYGDANGEYVKTQFFDAFTKGGLFLLDEMDASCPEALIVLNCAIANGYFDFPVLGRMKAHKDFRVIANANTYGTGASMEYVGRNQLDGATLNRFAVVEIGYDRRIEDGVCPDKAIADFCREFRTICDRNGVHHIVSYREMSRLNKMINVAGLEKDEALKCCLTKGLEADTLRMICGQMSDSLEYKAILKKLI